MEKNVDFGDSGTPNKARGPTIRKNNVSLGDPHILSLYRCNDPSVVVSVAACEVTLLSLC